MALTVTWERGQHRQRPWRAKLRAVAGSAASTVAALSKAAVSPHTASLKRLADMPLTVLGTAGVDFAAFHVVHGLGWLVTGVSLLVIEHMIADPEDGRRR